MTLHVDNAILFSALLLFAAGHGRRGRAAWTNIVVGGATLRVLAAQPD